MEKTNLSLSLRNGLKKFFRNLTECTANGSWNGTQLIVLVIVLAAFVLFACKMESLDHINYGF